MLRDAAWRDWYRAQHDRSCLLTGTSFEDYVTSALMRFHPDFFNPSPAGTFGDGGCDGLAESGAILYACYGSRAQRDAERRLRQKMESDFNRAIESWDSFTEWRFVSNAPAGPECARFLIDVQQAYAPGSGRVVAARFWDGNRLWSEIVGSLGASNLNDLFPGAPGIENVELSDLLPLLDVLGGDSDYIEQESSINPVPMAKMEYNDLSHANRLEFNSGRTMAGRIDRWFAEQADPDLKDHQGRNFRKIYERHRKSTTAPGELIERMYASIGGPNIRFDGRRANAVYAITAYFFDSCHIFEEPPPGFCPVT